MKLRDYIDVRAQAIEESVLAPVRLDDTPAPSIKGPAREPRNWWALGCTSIARALAENPLKNPVNPNDWLLRQKPENVVVQAGGPGSGRHKELFKQAGVEMPIINYVVNHKSQYESQRNVEFNTSHGTFFQRGDSVKDAKEKFLSWYLEKELRKRTVQAGGPGSGCHGDNCGRPAGPGHQLSWKESTLRKEGLKKSRKTGIVTIPLQATPRSQVKTVHQSPSGYKITELKTPRRGRPTGTTGIQQSILNRESPLKGSFVKEQENVKGTGWKGVATIWTAKRGATEGAGTSVMALRDIGKMAVTVMEVRTERYAEIGQTRVIRFNNFGQAAGFLKSRYGVSWKLPPKGAFNEA